MSTNHPETEGKTNPEAGKDTFNIVDGPSKDRIFDAFKYNENTEAFVSLRLRVLDHTRPSNGYHPHLDITEIAITGIEYGDLSGSVLRLKGFCKAALPDDDKMFPYQFTASYNSKNREGVISFYD